MPVGPPALSEINKYMALVDIMGAQETTNAMMCALAQRHTDIRVQLDSLADVERYIYAERCFNPPISSTYQFNDRMLQRCCSIENNIINSRDISFTGDVPVNEQQIMKKINDTGLKLLLSVMYHNITPRLCAAGGDVMWNAVQGWPYNLKQ